MLQSPNLLREIAHARLDDVRRAVKNTREARTSR